MNPTQRKAIETHRREFARTVNPDLFLTYLQIQGLISHVERQDIDTKYLTDDRKLIILLEILKGKTNGWSVMITYLRDEVKYESLVNKLENSANDSIASTRSTLDWQQQNFIVEFRLKLKNLYISEYSQVSTEFGHYKVIDDTGVTLQVDGIIGKLEKKDQLDHHELLRCMKKHQKPRVVLINGQT